MSSFARSAKDSEADYDGEHGVIVNGVSKFGMKDSLSFQCLSSAVRGMTLTLAREMAPMAIRVVTVVLGLVVKYSVGDLVTDSETDYLLRAVDSVVSNVSFLQNKVHYEDVANCINSILTNSMINATEITLENVNNA
ncbi:3-hydroxyacyl-CoA dehydrogenase type-2-like [Octopus sinensis]|uniref:3-hydroxyacyl-CoA dehydrogenase type-2-like n=1 Tax=Octopus sinensis TaxID=2607531 RepID=A0A6P7TQY8_9MOLL|nr:3-hydroxyacyl-CoA dehydrogenase type-2-like [Octopus sinensis]